MCLPTIRSFSNTLNITELQERVFLDWRPYIDRLNICLMRSRTINHSHQCAQQYLSEFNNVFLQHLKEILKEY